jgi:hypothetical protein
MAESNKRALAIGGILLTAARAAFLVMPAARQLGTFDGMWLAAAFFGLPTFALLAITGLPYYSTLRSLAIAAVVTAIGCAVALIVVGYTFATALAGTAADVVIATVLFGSPLLCVAIFGLLTLRITENRRSALEMAHSVGSR